MLTHICIKNVRSIEEAQIKVAPLTVLYGPNGSGKSTLFHALAIFKNIVLNPAQSIDNFFNLGFANFGGFEQVVFDHLLDNEIELKICSVHNATHITYGVSFNKTNGRFELTVGNPWDITLEMETSFPHSMNQITKTVEHDRASFVITWNGIISQVESRTGGSKAEKTAQELASVLNNPVSLLLKTDFVHLKRGFSKPYYSVVPLTPTASTEDEAATLIASTPYLEGVVSHYLEQIFQKELRVKYTPGTSLFWMYTTDKATGLSTELVNDGFGINQVVYLLTKSLRESIPVVCIEEPEIHLHPKALRNLAYALVRLVKEEEKTMLISTHSEHFVLALLGAVSKGILNPGDISFHLCLKDKKRSLFESQSVNTDGQIEGGLTTFMEGELEDLKDILGVSGLGHI